MSITRRRTKVVRVGNVGIGGNNPVVMQSMIKVKTADYEAAIAQIRVLEEAGCEIVRVAVKDLQDAQALRKIKVYSRIPLVADIHFDWRLAITAIQQGVDKIRLNPGNIDDKKQIASIVAAAKSHKIPIRVGINSGSVNPSKGYSAHRQAGSATVISRKKSAVLLMVQRAMSYVRYLERLHFYDIVLSLKASNIFDTLQATRAVACQCDYPLHLGVTATGSPESGIVKSSIALGALLLEGIGDTIRISLTDEPAREVRVAKNILQALQLRSFGPEIISCPTCGRCEVNLISVVKALEADLGRMHPRARIKPLHVAVMGCVVNGPGEAQDADIGVAFGKNEGLLFKKGKALRKVSYAKCVNTLIKEIKSL